MTDDEAIALGKRVVACKGFRPMRGMLDMQGRTWDASLLWRWHNEVDVPDLRDAATVGCLLALVREAWGAPRALVRLSSSGKSFHVFDVDRVTMGGNWAAFLCGDRILQTEAEALVSALEAAPDVSGEHRREEGAP
jgi:hypothetical protein